MLGKGWKTRNNSFVDLTSPYGIVVQKSGGMVDQNVISKRSPMQWTIKACNNDEKYQLLAIRADVYI